MLIRLAIVGIYYNCKEIVPIVTKVISWQYNKVICILLKSSKRSVVRQKESDRQFDQLFLKQSDRFEILDLMIACCIANKWKSDRLLGL